MSCSALSFSVLASVLLGGKLGLGQWVFAGAALLIYSFDRLLDHQEKGVVLARSWSGFRFWFACAGLWLLTVGLLIAQGMLALHLLGLLAGLPLCLLYSWSITIPGTGLKLRPLKEVPLLKGLFIAAAISVAALVLVGESAMSQEPRKALVAVFLFVLAYSNTQLFDMRDLAEDRMRGVPTLPVLWGVRRIRAHLIFLHIALLLVLFWSPVALISPIGLLMNGGVLLSLLLVCRSPGPGLRFDLIVDGLPQLLAIGAYLFVESRVVERIAKLP